MALSTAWAYQSYPISRDTQSTFQDLCFANSLVNHFSGPSFAEPMSFRATLRRQDQLSYALMDFDISMFLPPSVNRATFRLPYKESLLGQGPHPYDTAQGERDYDPFAFDVGTLGVAFCYAFQVSPHTYDLDFKWRSDSCHNLSIYQRNCPCLRLSWMA
jgi:hypothetical protein